MNPIFLIPGPLGESDEWRLSLIRHDDSVFLVVDDLAARLRLGKEWGQTNRCELRVMPPQSRRTSEPGGSRSPVVSWNALPSALTWELATYLRAKKYLPVESIVAALVLREKLWDGKRVTRTVHNISDDRTDIRASNLEAKPLTKRTHL